MPFLVRELNLGVEETLEKLKAQISHTMPRIVKDKRRWLLPEVPLTFGAACPQTRRVGRTGFL